MYSTEAVTSVTDETLLWTAADEQAYSRLTATLGQLIEREVDMGLVYEPKTHQETQTPQQAPEVQTRGRHRRQDVSFSDDPYNAPRWGTGTQARSGSYQPTRLARQYQRQPQPVPTVESYWGSYYSSAQPDAAPASSFLQPAPVITANRPYGYDNPADEGYPAKARSSAPTPEDDLPPLHLDIDEQPGDTARKRWPPKDRPAASPSHRERERRPVNPGPGRDFKPAKDMLSGHEIRGHRRQSRVGRVLGHLAMAASFSAGLFCLVDGITNHLTS